MQKPSRITYFEREGRDNLPDVIKVVGHALKSREELRALKLVIFTAKGEGPLLAWNHFASEYETRIIAVTFPLSFSVRKADGTVVTPRIPPKVQKFFAGVGITIVTPPILPFDSIEGMGPHNQQMKLVKDTISLFGGGFSLCIQAVLHACDAGLADPDEQVIAMSGDCAALMTAALTSKFLSFDSGMSIQEVLCKPKNLNIARRGRAMSPSSAQRTFEVIEGTPAPRTHWEGAAEEQDQLPERES